MSRCSKIQLQCFLGSLLYFTKCVRPARFYRNRMFHLLRNHHYGKYKKLSQQFHCNLNWFNVFLGQYNSITFFLVKLLISKYTWMLPCRVLVVFWTSSICFTSRSGFNHLHIIQLEMLNVVVALKVWANKMSRCFATIWLLLKY